MAPAPSYASPSYPSAEESAAEYDDDEGSGDYSSAPSDYEMASDDEDNHLRDISYSLQDQFREVFQAGIDSGDLSGRFSADILSEMVMGTSNNMMVQWALDSSYPLYEKLEEARDLFQHILSED